MAAFIFAALMALLLFALSGEANTEFLRIAGTVAAVFMAIAAAATGWQWARRD